jgi:hypothetical protein
MRLTELAYRLDGSILSESEEGTYDFDDLNKEFVSDLLEKKVIPFCKELNFEKISPTLFSFIEQMRKKTGKPYKVLVNKDIRIRAGFDYIEYDYYLKKGIKYAKLFLQYLKNGNDPLMFVSFNPLDVYDGDRTKNDFWFGQDDADQISKNVQSLFDKKFGQGLYLVRCFLSNVTTSVFGGKSGKNVQIQINAGPKLQKSFQDSLERAINSEESKPKVAAKSAAKGASGGQKWSVALVEIDGEEAIEVWEDYASYKEAFNAADSVGVEEGQAVYVVKGTQRYLKPLGVTEEGDDDATVWLVNSYE